MKSIFNECIERIQHSKQRYRRYVAILLVLSLCTTLGVNWGLHQNGIAQTTDVQCGLDEHQHSAECYEKVLKCTDEEHKHTDSCYEKQLTCERQEHTHSVNCFSDTSKDVEDASVWEATLPTTLSGIWADDLVAVAESQLDYKESADNFEADESGVKKGYTRYGAFYGNEYADWSTMFAAFCLNYAGISTDYVPANSGCEAWIVDLGKAGLYRSADYTPSVGDMALLSMDAESGTGADHVGIISNIETDNAGNVSKITMVIGDNNDAVTEEVYSYNATEYTITPENETDVAGTVVGYCALPEQPEDSNTNTDADATTDITVDDTTADDTVNDTTADEPTGDATDVVDGADDANTDTNVEPSDEPGTKTDDTTGIVDGDTANDSTADTPSADESGDSTDAGSGEEVADDETSEAKEGLLDTLVDGISGIFGADDVSVVADSGTAYVSTSVTKPTYSGTTTPSSEKTKTTTISGINDASVSAASDKATSDIENNFTETKEQDGKVLTDKSVIYGNDDYSNLTYEDGEFGVTLSALGQEYPVVDEDEFTTPLDVVFVLDVSNSMRTETVDGQDVNNQNAEKAKRIAMVDAVNTAMKTILQSNELNRVGVVLFSSGSWTLLEVNRYTASNDTYLTITNSGRGMIKTTRSLAIENGRTIGQIDGGSVQNIGTYTQSGIARGAEVFQSVSDTSYTVTTKKGRKITGQRQPVFIMVTDGIPTHCNSDYTNVIGSSKTNTSGNGSEADDKAIAGYYTILSANHYKGVVGEYYKQTAQFYTIAEGLSGLNSSTSDKDLFACGVLNPDTETMNALASSRYSGTRVGYLRDMLSSSYSTPNPVTVNALYHHNSASNDGTPYNNMYSIAQIASTHRDNNQTYTRTLTTVSYTTNPYSSYSYADDAYFGQMTTSELEEKFKSIIQKAPKVNIYNFILQESTDVNIVDPIGTYMEVKGKPILHYGNSNYEVSDTSTSSDGNGGTVTTYKYEYRPTYGELYPENYKSGSNSHHQSTDTLDLSQIIVTVTKDASGNQTVQMHIPAALLPVYYPYADTSETFYYHELPVRLIYKVGLSDEGISNANAKLENEEEVVYYTNRWDGGTTTTATFTKSNDNPYGFNDPSVDKENSPTDTLTTSFTESKSSSNEKTVTQSLGNNGKLIIKPSAPTTQITVKKVWDDKQSSHNAVNFSVTQISSNGTEKEDFRTGTLNESNNWTQTFEDLPAKNRKGTVTYSYSVKETNVPDGYIVSYSDSLDNDGYKIFTITNTSKDNIAVQVEKQWFNTDGTKMDTPPEDVEVTGTLYRTKSQQINNAVTVTLKAKYTERYLWVLTKEVNVDLRVISDIASGTNLTFTMSDSPTSVTSSVGETTASSSGRTVTVNNVIDGAVITVNYGELSNAPTIDGSPTYTKSQISTSDPEKDASFSKTFTLSSDNNWRKYWTSRELDEEEGYTYTYYVEENEIDGYKVTYENNNVTSTSDSKTIVVKNTKNRSFELPQTGGVGTTPFTAAGVAVVGAALLSGHHLRRRRERRGE